MLLPAFPVDWGEKLSSFTKRATPSVKIIWNFFSLKFLMQWSNPFLLSHFKQRLKIYKQEIFVDLLAQCLVYATKCWFLSLFPYPLIHGSWSDLIPESTIWQEKGEWGSGGDSVRNWSKGAISVNHCSWLAKKKTWEYLQYQGHLMFKSQADRIQDKSSWQESNWLRIFSENSFYSISCYCYNAFSSSSPHF